MVDKPVRLQFTAQSTPDNKVICLGALEPKSPWTRNARHPDPYPVCCLLPWTLSSRAQPRAKHGAFAEVLTADTGNPRASRLGRNSQSAQVQMQHPAQPSHNCAENTGEPTPTSRHCSFVGQQAGWQPRHDLQAKAAPPLLCRLTPHQA